MTTSTKDRLPVNEGGFQPGWDFKSNYVSSLKEDSYERFSQFSATPDTTMLYAGPARFTGIEEASELTPIGLVDGITVQSNPSLARLFEIGSNRSFFTRGKTASGISFSKMLADQANILAACTTQAYRPLINPNPPGSETSPELMMNLDSEYFGVPFGLMLVMKTRGGGTIGEGKVLTAVYLEYCMFSNYSFGISSGSPVILESISVEFDRFLPVSLN